MVLRSRSVFLEGLCGCSVETGDRAAVWQSKRATVGLGNKSSDHESVQIPKILNRLNGGERMRTGIRQVDDGSRRLKEPAQVSSLGGEVDDRKHSCFFGGKRMRSVGALTCRRDISGEVLSKQESANLGLSLLGEYTPHRSPFIFLSNFP